MNVFRLASVFLILSAVAASAASIVNKDDQPYALTVTEGGEKSEIAVAAGQTLSLCKGGCFIVMPNGDRETLSGGETVEIKGGRARIK